MSIHEFEALIIGAGGAGLYAALEASRTAKTAVPFFLTTSANSSLILQAACSSDSFCEPMMII